MKNRAFTLIEILVVLAILGILAALIFPVFSRVRESAHRSNCMSNQRQVAAAMQMYVQDNSRLPTQDQIQIQGQVQFEVEGQTYTAFDWEIYQPYLKSRAICRCPEDQIPYFQRATPGPNSLVPGPRTVVAYCKQHATSGNRSYYLPTPSGGQYLVGSYVVARFDGSASVVPGVQTREWVFDHGKWHELEMSIDPLGQNALPNTRFPGEDWPLDFN